MPEPANITARELWERTNTTVIVKDWEKIGAAMRRAREATELSLREVARQMKISPAYLSHAERGWRSMPLHRLELYFNIVESK